MTDEEFAARLAHDTGQLLLAVNGTSLLSGHDLGDAGDSLAQEFIAQALAIHRPHDAVLSEEARDEASRLTAKRVWIVDPLDGTSEFRRRGDDWAVHIALVENGVPTASAVALPPRGSVFRSDQVGKADGPLTGSIVVSRGRTPWEALLVAKKLGMALDPVNSAGVKAMAVVEGRADAYVHSGGQHQWDSAAPVGVALAAGLWCSRLSGAPLVYNTRSTYLPDLVICRMEVKDDILAALQALRR
ncbi:MAG: 3'(2'),5'-bisphosphate nucleotidase CysQ [Segniliparus sp.]|uniref:3'(2'),5'-bisphosphate nucleotidase CysQ n=1 Tax=Segniliparus sp. TaxID=2804064 RepID=UPI003F36E9C3